MVLSVPELLAPAGNLEKLEMALLYGADAVYCGLDQFSLRAHAGNLSFEELSRACELTEKAGKRLYLTLNAYLRPGEEVACRKALTALRSFSHDACIVADPGMLCLLRDIDPDRDVHLSTQANTTNAIAAQFWQSQKVKRLNLARELTLEEIHAVRSGTDLELETFVHGAMCVAYSGRCLLSAALSDRSANRGDCSHPCRWQYSLQEESRPDQQLPIEEDARGTYLFNSRDLCLIDSLPDLIGAGIDSFKIEGRMKSLYYVAAVTRVYRAALDAFEECPDRYAVDPAWRRELEAVSHRPYGSGFLYGDDTAFVHAEDSTYRRDCDFVGIVRQKTGPDSWQVEVRNRFFPGEGLELIGPGMRQSAVPVQELTSLDGRHIDVAQPNAQICLSLPSDSQPGDLLRRWK